MEETGFLPFGGVKEMHRTLKLQSSFLFLNGRETARKEKLAYRNGGGGGGVYMALIS